MDEILEILENNARISNKEISKLVKLPEIEVEKKIKKFKDKGVIVKYKTVIDKTLIAGEKTVMALIEVKVSPQKDVGFDAIAERIYRFEEVKNCYLVSGTYDLLVIVEGSDMQTVANFVAEKLSPLDSVKATTTHFLLKKYKEDGVTLKKKISNNRLNITY